MTIPSLQLSNDRKIPQVGLGLWQVKDQADFDRAMDVAIDAGYRHFDTAQAYGNEQYLGEAWRRSGIKRNDLFITTKISVQHFGKEHAHKTFAESLQKLQTDYVDLLLLHFPLTLLRKTTWKALEEIHAAGQAKAIGVSNYTTRHMEEMRNYADIWPAVNQVELHVFLQQPKLIEFCQANNIVVEAYSPLAHARIMDDPAIAAIAKKHGKSYSQIMLAWLAQQGLVVLPKSITPARIKENIDIFDFKLDKPDFEAIAKLDRDFRTCWNPNFVP